MDERAPASKESPAGLRGRLPGSRVFYAWLLVVVFSCIVLWLGSPNFSSSRSYLWLVKFLRFFDPEIQNDSVMWVHGMLRKTAHVVVYAALALLAFRASLYSFGKLLTRVAVTAILVAIGVALIDESRQATFESRTGSPYDVAIDAAGGILAVGIAVVIVRRRLGSARESGAS